MTAAPSALDRPGGIGTRRAVLTVFLPFAGGYFLSYLYRSVNAVIAPQLIGDIGLTAADLGLLTAAYFLAFAAFQIPLGVLLDRYGPRRVQAALLLVAAVGALIFSIGTSRDALMLGRGLIGFGVAGGLMAAFKAITLWFPRARWPLVNGCFVAMGGLGAMAATAPVEALLQVTDWRGIFVGLSVATLGVSLVILVVVPEARAAVAKEGLTLQVATLKRIYSDVMFWRLAPLGAVSSATSMSIIGLWAGPWLKDIAGLDRPGIAAYLLATAGALALGSVGTGLAADLLGRIGIGATRVMAVGVLVYMLAQAAIVFQLDPTGLWPWLLFALMANVTMLVYPEISAHFGIETAGRAITALNVLVFAFAFTAQYAIGWIIDFWPLAPDGGYLPAAYRIAFGVCLAVQAAAFGWFLYLGWRGSPQERDADT